MCHAYPDKNATIYRFMDTAVKALVAEIAELHSPNDKGEECMAPIYAVRIDGLTYCAELSLHVEKGRENELLTIPLRRELTAMGFDDIFIEKKNGTTYLFYSLLLEKELPVEVDARD